AHILLTRGTGARSLRLGLRVARGVHWSVRAVRRLTGGAPSAPAVAGPMPPPAGPAEVRTPAGTPQASKKGGPFMTAGKRWIKAGLRGPWQIVKWLLRPVAARARGYLVAPLTPYLEAVPRLCVLLDQHGSVLSQLQSQQSGLQERFGHLTQQVAHLHE